MSDKPRYDDGITLEKLEALLEELSKEQPRNYTAVIPCKTRGLVMVNFSDYWMCGNAECHACSSFENAIRDVVGEQVVIVDPDKHTDHDELVEKMKRDLSPKKIDPKGLRSGGSKYHK